MSDVQFAPEELVLLRAVSAGLRSAFGLPVRAVACEEGLNAPQLVRLAVLHGVSGIAWEGLRAGVGAPEEAINGLRTNRDQEVAAAVRHCGELLRLMELFGGAGIEVLPLKGPLFAQRVYGNLSRRSFWDLDLLLHAESVLHARELLLADGYQPEHEWSARRERRELRRNCEYNFDHPERHVHVELHWGFVEPTIGFDLPLDGVWERARTIGFLGRDLSVPDLVDEVLAMIVHNGAKHAWQRLRMIADVAAVLLRLSPSQRDDLEHRASCTGTRRIVATGVRLASHLLDLPFDRAGASGVDDPPARTIDFYLGELFRFDVHRHPDAVLAARAYLSTRERFRDRIRYLPRLARAVFTPTHREQEFLPLPAGVRWLHIVVRPARLAWKYLVKNPRFDRRNETTGHSS